MEKLKERINNKGAHNLIYPFNQIPEPGKMLKVADGIFWVRMGLPFALNHINLWVLEDGDDRHGAVAQRLARRPQHRDEEQRDGRHLACELRVEAHRRAQLQLSADQQQQHRHQGLRS